MNSNIVVVSIAIVFGVLMSLALPVLAKGETAESIESEFRSDMKMLSSLQVYNQQIQLQIKSQEISKEKLIESKNSSKNFQRELLPLLNKMVDGLDAFVQSDIPFSLDVRQKGIQQLRSSMAGAGSLLSDQYRQIFSLYQIEDGYGRGYEAYTGSLEVDGNTLTVDYLRIGRLGFYYQTKDGKSTAMWNKSQSKWIALPKEYSRHIRKAIRIASKTMAPELIRLPLIAPEKF